MIYQLLSALESLSLGSSSLPWLSIRILFLVQSPLCYRIDNNGGRSLRGRVYFTRDCLLFGFLCENPNCLDMADIEKLMEDHPTRLLP
jgi:hypothetical protein